MKKRFDASPPFRARGSSPFEADQIAMIEKDLQFELFV